MRAWWVHEPGPIGGRPLRRGDLPDPEPGPGQIRVRVSTCGVCRTDLHLSEGDLAPHRPNTVPGHEVVGVVDLAGPDATRFAVGDRVGIAWLRHTCGTCRFCRRGDENLCLTPAFTGWDHHGGFAELAVVDERFAYRIPEVFDDLTAAPLLCAGIIGFRALRRSGLRPGGRLGIYGFGASAHLAAQVALHEGAELHVMTRSPARGSSRSTWAPNGRVAPPTHRRSPWMRRSSSLPSVNWSPRRCRRWTGAGSCRSRDPPERHPVPELPA